MNPKIGLLIFVFTKRCFALLALIYENAVVFTVRRPFGAHIPNGLISDKAKDNFLETRCSLG